MSDRRLFTLFVVALLLVGASAHAAARRVIQSACSTIDSYYWEIGDRSGVLASGSVVGRSGKQYSASSVMQIASASKWLYGAYVAQTKALTADDIRFLTMSSGYHTFSACTQLQTVASCSAAGSNGVFTPADAGKFYYSGAHFQKHAASSALGPMKAPALGAAVSNTLGVTVAYTQPQLAGGAVATPATYAAFLRRLMRGELALGAMLGTNAVCTNPATCATALNAPIPQTESWHYSLGHWVEDDPAKGDGSFSSPGVNGFYPWINADRTRYGIVARDSFGGSWGSVQCGREIRAAYR